MSDLIYRKTLADSLLEYEGLDITFGMMMEKVFAVPAADATEVVWCRDCKFWRNLGAVDNCLLPSGLSHATPDCYCSLGRRRDGV